GILVSIRRPRQHRAAQHAQEDEARALHWLENCVAHWRITSACGLFSSKILRGCVALPVGRISSAASFGSRFMRACAAVSFCCAATGTTEVGPSASPTQVVDTRGM